MGTKINDIFKFVFVAICFMVVGVFLLSNNIKAEETNKNTLLEGIEIEGPDYVYEYEKNVTFTLRKEGYQTNGDPEENAEEAPYIKLHYDWSSEDENVAKFYRTEYYYAPGCIVMTYFALKRPNIFQVQSGVTTIFCTISDDEGNSVTLSKHLTVIKETPIKALQLGKYKVPREELNSAKGNIYANDIIKNLKLELTLEEGWKLISEDALSIDAEDDYRMDIKLRNESLGREFCYKLYIYRYITHTIDLSNLKDGCALVTRSQREPPFQRNYATVVKYDKISDMLNPTLFKSGEELVEKFKKYYEYDDRTVSYNNGIFTYKETEQSPLWIYCQNQTELNNAIENACAQTSFLFGFAIKGPDSIYENQKNVKFYLSKILADKKQPYDYSDLKFNWEISNTMIAKIAGRPESYNLLPETSTIDYGLLSGVKNGKITISCTISNETGKNLLTVSKKVTVLKVNPIKKLYIENCKLIKTNTYATKGKIYAKQSRVKLKIALKKNWKVKRIRVYQGSKGKTITKKKTFVMKAKKNYRISIKLVNKKTNETYSYECRVRRYNKKAINRI